MLTWARGRVLGISEESNGTELPTCIGVWRLEGLVGTPLRASPLPLPGRVPALSGSHPQTQSLPGLRRDPGGAGIFQEGWLEGQRPPVLLPPAPPPPAHLPLLGRWGASASGLLTSQPVAGSLLTLCSVAASQDCDFSPCDWRCPRAVPLPLVEVNPCRPEEPMTQLPGPGHRQQDTPSLCVGRDSGARTEPKRGHPNERKRPKGTHISRLLFWLNLAKHRLIFSKDDFFLRGCQIEVTEF